MIQLTLLGTEHCHLCDDAAAELESHRLFSKVPYQVTVKDIIDDESLFDRYRKLIPVIINESTGQEMSYPFAITELMVLLEGKEVEGE